MSIYYVIESEYVGPNTQGRIDSHLVTITTDAPRTNLSHEVRLDGWIGTTNDTSRHAHGAYTSEDDAREAVAELFGRPAAEEPTALAGTGTIQALQFLLLAIGVAASLYTARRIAYGRYRTPARRRTTLTPYVAVIIALTAGGVWLTRHPFPQVSMAPVATVVGLAALVYSSRNKS